MAGNSQDANPYWFTSTTDPKTLIYSKQTKLAPKCKLVINKKSFNLDPNTNLIELISKNLRPDELEGKLCEEVNINLNQFWYTFFKLIFFHFQINVWNTKTKSPRIYYTKEKIKKFNLFYEDFILNQI